MNFDQFKDKAAKILNIKLDGYKIKRVKRRTDSLMRRRDVDDYRECLALIKNDLNFRRAYINHFTINTSEFYRNPKNYQHLQDKILPELLAKNNKLKIWSAPCSNGSEPYTVAIILTEMGISSSRYEILASDLDPDIISDARRGLYKENAVKDVPDSILKKYFTINDNSDKLFPEPDSLNEISSDYNGLTTTKAVILLSKILLKQNSKIKELNSDNSIDKKSIARGIITKLRKVMP